MEALMKVSDLSIQELKILIKEVMIEILKDFNERRINIDNEEQLELEAMFGDTPYSDKPIYSRQIEI